MTRRLRAGPLAKTRPDGTRRAPKVPPVAPKTKDAVHFLLTQEFDFVRAAQVAGLTVQRLRDELGRPHVLKHLRAEKRALLTATCANNPVALSSIISGSKNDNARVRAIALSEALLQQADESRANPVPRQAGLVIVVQSRPQQPPERLGMARSVTEPGAIDREVLDAEIIDDDPAATR